MTTVDEVLTLLHERRRRYLLYYLSEQRGPVPVTELVDAVAGMEAEETPIPDGRFDRVEVELVHSHLPEMKTAEFVEYDPDERVVRLTDEPPAFDAILTIAKVLEET